MGNSYWDEWVKGARSPEITLLEGTHPLAPKLGHLKMPTFTKHPLGANSYANSNRNVARTFLGFYNLI